MHRHLDIYSKLFFINAYINQNISKLNASLSEVYGLGTKIPANSDLNSYTTPGCYRSSDSANTVTLKNKPSSVTNGFRMEVKANSVNTFVKQFLFANEDIQRIYIRQIDEGIAKEWYVIELQEDS